MVARSLVAGLPEGRIVGGCGPRCSVPDDASDPLALSARYRPGSGRCAGARGTAGKPGSGSLRRAPRRVARSLPERPRRALASDRALAFAPRRARLGPTDDYFPLAESLALVARIPSGRLTVTGSLDQAIPELSLHALADLARVDGWIVRALRAARQGRDPGRRRLGAVTESELLARTAAIAADYVESLDTRPVGATRTYREMHMLLDAPLPESPVDATAVVEEMARLLDPGITAMGSGRYFGFVIGGALPASLAADWLVSTWDQNTGLAEPTPATSALEAVAGRWVIELLGLPLPLVVRVRHRMSDGARDVPRGRSACRLRPCGMGPSREGPRGRAAAPRRRRRQAPRNADEGASPASGSARRKRSCCRPTRRDGWT